MVKIQVAHAAVHVAVLFAEEHLPKGEELSKSLGFKKKEEFIVWNQTTTVLGFDYTMASDPKHFKKVLLADIQTIQNFWSLR